MKRYQLTDSNIRVQPVYDFEYRLVGIFDGYGTPYLRITRDYFGNVLTYEDHIGNWYDSTEFNFKCPYDGGKLFEEIEPSFVYRKSFGKFKYSEYYPEIKIDIRPHADLLQKMLQK